jgi:hypothetical protein
MLECGGRLRRAVSEQPNKRTIPSQSTDRFNVIRRLRCSSLSALVGSNMEQTGKRGTLCFCYFSPMNSSRLVCSVFLSQQQKAGYKRRHLSQVFSIPYSASLGKRLSHTAFPGLRGQRINARDFLIISNHPAEL